MAKVLLFIAVPVCLSALLAFGLGKILRRRWAAIVIAGALPSVAVMTLDALAGPWIIGAAFLLICFILPGGLLVAATICAVGMHRQS
jgi:hypothetical protein